MRLLLVGATLCGIGGTAGTLCAQVAGAPTASQVIDLETLSQGGFRSRTWQYVSAQRLSAPVPSDGWRPARTILPRGDSPADWNGIGWFRWDFDVGTDVVGQPLGLVLDPHLGASRVVLGERLLDELGSIAGDAATGVSIVARTTREPIIFTIDRAGLHSLLVLFANPDLSRYHRVGTSAGFSARLFTAERAVAVSQSGQRRFAGLRGLFSGIFVSFALLHLLLYLFRRKAVENLYFAIFCLALAALAFALVHKELALDPRLRFWTESLMNAAGLAFGGVGVLFVYSAFGRRLSSAGKLLLLAALVFAPFAVAWPAATVLGVFLVILLGLVEMARCVLAAFLRGDEGSKIVGAGVLAINVGFGAGILANLGLLPSGVAFGVLLPFGSVLVLIVSMSVFLARRFARTHQRLEHQLERVRVLSDQRLEQERRERQSEVRTKLLEAEIERKEVELEEARQLQLSMLPQNLPDHPDLEVAAHMTTATEVGGDYYDFDVAADGTMTIAVGDATGHGMRAGTMVTATKSLFNALASDEDMVNTVKRSNLALKRMNLRSLNMALLLARYRDGQLKVSAAGMPQPLIYRAANGAVETLEIGGMPLGSVRSFPYTSVQVPFQSGDKVLFMSDGFPERLNPAEEQLGYPAAERLFRDAGDRSVGALVEHLVNAGEEWAQGVPADDDVTFVVVAAR